MKNKYSPKQAGFTLVELLIVLAISGVVLAGIYSSFQSQDKSYRVQNEVAIIQQNLRAAMSHMSHELRMVAYSPINNSAGFETIKRTEISFTKEITNDGATTQTVHYKLYDNKNTRKKDLGVAFDDAAPPSNPSHLLAENIDAFEILYLDKDGNQTTNKSQITSIKISILASSPEVFHDYVNDTVYVPASCKIPNVNTVDCLSSNESWQHQFNDHHRRRLLISTIQLRNVL